MRNLMYCLVILFIVGCQETSESSTAADSLQEPLNSSGISPQYQFQLVGQVNNRIKTVTQIQIFNKKDGSLHQTLEGFQSEVQENEEVIIEDINFDGYPDIRVLQYLPSTSNIPYFYWLYDPQKGEFIRNKMLEQVTSPALDQTGEYLLSQWAKDKDLVGTDYYRFEGQKIVLLKRETQRYTEPNAYIFTVEERIGDSMQVTKKELIRDEEVIF